MMWIFVACIGLAAAALPDDYPVRVMRGVRGNVPMPMIGIGTWQYNNSLAEDTVSTAFKMGYRHVDTALGYGNHMGVGEALGKSGLQREEYFVTTKIPGGLNATGTLQAVTRSLRELGLDYVDLMLIHYPASWTGEGGPDARKEEWLALEEWAMSGGARAIGVSHYCKSHIEDLLSVATLPISINQVEYHVGMGPSADNVNDDRDWMESQGIVYQSFSPLCGPCADPMELITGEVVTEIGMPHEKSGPQVALRWLTQQNIPIIPKSSNPKHMASNMDVFDWDLTDVEMKTLTDTATPASAENGGDCTVALEEAKLV